MFSFSVAARQFAGSFERADVLYLPMLFFVGYFTAMHYGYAPVYADMPPGAGDAFLVGVLVAFTSMGAWLYRRISAVYYGWRAFQRQRGA